MRDPQVRPLPRGRAGFVLALIILLALLALVLGWVMMPVKAHAATGKCIKPAAFLASLSRSGGTATPVPSANYPKARRLLELAAKASPPASDTAWLQEMPDGSSGIVFAAKGCVSTLWLTPPFVPLTALKSVLLREKIVAPPRGGSPDDSDRLGI